eukprot:TRINITY_DN15514_c0_g1_i1.p1 TRINITY_DN15514_c0_g1~~TRINITY_DN15514_c0_g1_i1.p1  ORF type:complete len:257 (+),score=25.78 TRINITY_DN15514_c0_g1_i1:91-771(+)
MSFLRVNELLERDISLRGINIEKYQKPASDDAIFRTVDALKKNSHTVEVVNGRYDALAAIKKFIPEGASVLNAASTTLAEIGFVSHLKMQSKWRNLHAEILAVTDQAKQAELRRKVGGTADYFVSSVNAITEDGEIVVVDWSGTRTGPIVSSPGKVVIVVGANKLVPTYRDAKRRTKKMSLPFESARSRIAYGMMGVTGSQNNNFGALLAVCTCPPSIAPPSPHIE